jgi:hypothetical protein
MADFYSVVAGGVGTLDRNTREARRRLYERARMALLSKMHTAEPPISRSAIMAAQMCLEAAIEKVEAEALREQHDRMLMDTSSTVFSHDGEPSPPT